MFKLSRLPSIGHLVESFSRRSRGPLPEVSEVDWSEWESCVSSWQEAGGSSARVAPERLERRDKRH